MYSRHPSVFPSSNNMGFTHQKSLSTRITSPTQNSECRQLIAPQQEITKSNVLLEIQSIVSFGQQQIKTAQINDLFQAMKLIRFLDKETKQLGRMINIKKKNISVLYQKREDKVKDIQVIKKQVEVKFEYLSQKSKELRLRNKERQIHMNYKIKLMKQKIKRVKSLSRDQSRITYKDTSRISNMHEIKSNYKYRHKRMYTQLGYQQSHHKEFVPIYVPYPVFAPYNQPPQHHQRPFNNHRMTEYSLQKEYFQVKENSEKYSQRNSRIYINPAQRQQQKIKDFCSKLKEPLAENQSKRYGRKQSRKSQNLQSLRNSLKTNSSKKSHIKPKVNKGPFQTDEEIQHDQKNMHSKMGIKITTSHTCEEQTQDFYYNNKKINKDLSKIPIIQDLQNSTINLDIPSDKKQNSSWQKDTIERLKKIQSKNNTFQQKNKMKHRGNDKSISQIEHLQQNQLNSSLNGSDINIIVTQSPAMNNVNGGLKKGSPLRQGQNARSIENKDLLNSKKVAKVQRFGYMNQIKVKKEQVPQIVKEVKAKELVSSQVQINDISDQELFGSINLVAESKISRDSRNKEIMVKQVKEQEDQILTCINLTPESRISRLSRQKQALKASRSQLKQASTFHNVEQKTSISDIRQSRNLNTTQIQLASSQQNQLQMIQYESELRSTTPSRIVQNGKKPVKQSKIDFMSGSIEEATQEEQNNQFSQIKFKNNKRGVKRAK